MALLNRRPKKARPDRPLTAAGARLDLTNPQPNLLRRRDWQDAAWAYRDSVPELRFAMTFIANSLSRLRVYAAENQPRGEDPIPLSRDGDSKSTISARTQAAAIACMERLDLDARGTNMLGRLGENLDVAAEAYLLGETDPNSPTGESWSVRSVTELRVDASGRITLVEPGNGRTVEPRILEPGSVELLRIWRPHPQFYLWPDSELAALLDTCEELRLYDRLLRAAVRSRIASGLALFVPDELSLSRAGNAPVRPDVDGVPDDEDPFMQELIAAMIEPISQEDSPDAVVPMVIRGPAFMQDKPTKEMIGVIELGRSLPEDILARRDAAALKLGRGINLPPEVLSGLGDTNHWSAWSIDANTCKNHIEPRAEAIVDAFTMAYLRPSLLEMKCPPDEIARICAWYDPSELVQNPNRGQDARDAHDRGVLSDDALGRHLGFPEEDRPGIYERVFRAIEQRALDPQQIPVMLAAANVRADDPLMVIAVAAAKAQATQQRAVRGQGPQVIDQEPGPTPDAPAPVRPTPRPPPAITSSAAPARWRVREQMCHELARIDATLTTQLLAQADATVGRAVEQAANRIRARAVKNPELAAQFRGRPAHEVVAELGRRVFDLQDNRHLDDAVDAFGQQWESAVGVAAERVAEVSAEMLGTPKDNRLVEALRASARDAWQWLAQQIREVIQGLLYGGRPGELPGEKPAGPVPPKVIRGALALAGGMPPGSAVEDSGTSRAALSGLATGETAGSWRTERGAVDLGYEWQYYGLSRDSFPGHRALSGRRFVSWTDDVLAVRPGDEWLGISHYHCGDHDGCLCGFLPIMAVPMDPKEGRALADAAQITETEGHRQARVLLAEADDAAGRVGTTAQLQRDARAELARLRRIHIEERESP